MKELKRFKKYENGKNDKKQKMKMEMKSQWEREKMDTKKNWEKKELSSKRARKKIVQMTRGHTTRKLNEKYLKLIIYYEWNKDEKKNYDGIIKKKTFPRNNVFWKEKHFYTSLSHSWYIYIFSKKNHIYPISTK